jgi:hypothetical protein
VKRASTIPPSFLVQEKYLQGVVFYAEGQYVAAHGSEILYSRTITLKRMPVYSKGYVNAVQRQCDRSG